MSSKYSSKLIVIRGNSASGKSTVAKRIREVSGRKIAIVEQDYIRRFILKEKENEGVNNIHLIEQIVGYALSKDYMVILEGILHFPRYGDMLRRLADVCEDYHFYYLDVDFDETLKRHVTKSVANDYGEREMREWYQPKQTTGFKGEMVIPQESSIEETVALILKSSGIA